MTDLISRADAESDDLIIKGAKGIQDGLYNIKDGKLFMYKANGGTVRTYPIVPSADPTEDYSDLPDIPRAYYEKIVGNMSHEINMLKEQLESADAVHGEWKLVDHEVFAGEYFCSICGKRAEVDLYGEWILSNYCPSCGARMENK